MNLKKSHFALIVALVSTSLVSTLMAGCGVGVASTPGSQAKAISAPLPVRVVAPEITEIFSTYHTTSTLVSDRDAPISARVEGEVVAWFVEEGDWVEKGQTLARLDGDRLRIQMNQAKANLEKTTREYERYINLHKRGLVSTASFDGMKFDLDALNASYKLGKLNYGYTFIRASISGVVSSRYIKVGQHVSVGDTTFRITDPSELIAYLQIPQNELARFSVGHAANIYVDSMPDQVFDASIERISPTIDARNGTFRATATIDNSAALLAPGMFGRFEIAIEKHTNALVIPTAAVIEEDNVAVVYVVEDGTARRRTITTGIEENGQIEVLSGLSGFEQIIVTGQSGLRDGTRVLASIPNSQSITG